MIKWWRRRLYSNDVMAQLMAMTLMIGRAEGDLLKRHPGIRAAIRQNFDQDTSAMVTATHLSAALIAHALENHDDIVRKQIVDQLLSEWSALEYAEQRTVTRGLVDGTLQQDSLLTRCQWLLLRGQDLLLDKKIETHDLRILKDSIYGPLKGDPRGSRAIARIDEALDAAFGGPL